ncbi:NAD(P)/FAD-dependent oxidoreductase [Arthrobacter mobilis]|uniref:NAD(P)/FAD-dependent oxidoreductase n=1 Tax=Arthrobacter mobilis TaxID=2724944 RepID=A0A7X6HFL6_9MICC|nr:FAD-dependent oxidoreductase [Arthrobacter mobilis]NKX56254.1 NAD(P)/FAD-dependent oxidoreductase [Arthrobacter mobilis]
MEYECVIIGGGVAGLAAAMVLARARRRVLLLDSGRQNNLRTSHSGGVFLHDGGTPAAMYEAGLRQLRAYPTFSYRQETVVEAQANDGGGFGLLTASGRTEQARTLVLAQGVDYEPSPVPGVDALWGTKVVHCPFCDGYESRNLRVLALGEPEWLEHMREILPNWVDDIAWADPSEVARLDGGGQDDGPVVVSFSDGRQAEFGRVFAQQKFRLRDGIADMLGCGRTGSGDLETDPRGLTTVPGVFAAGDQTTGAQQVNLAIGSGHAAGMGAVFALSAARRAAASAS